MDESEGRRNVDEDLKFQVVSDLHLEFTGTERILPEIPQLSNVLLLLGDIGYASEQNYQEYIKYQSTRFNHVFVVAGNHEYYNQSSYDESNQIMSDYCNQIPNVYFMHKRSVQIGDVVFLGCTLWPKIPEEHEDKIGLQCNDYRRIKIIDQNSTRPLFVSDTNSFHANEVAWLQTEITKIKESNKKLNEDKSSSNPTKIVVITHHAPSKYRCIEPQSRGKPIEHIEYDNLEYMFGDPVVAWCHGHTHWTSDNIIEGTRVVSNQCGYIAIHKPSNEFKPEKVISVKETMKMISDWKDKGSKNYGPSGSLLDRFFGYFA